MKIINMIDPTMVTTNIELSGYRIIKNLGIVRGITVRSRSIVGNIAGGFQTIFGGNISIYQELCERTREDAFQLMLQSAADRRSKSNISIRYDTNEALRAVTEMLPYRTVVATEKII